jgi:hypothetical protein
MIGAKEVGFPLKIVVINLGVDSTARTKKAVVFSFAPPHFCVASRDTNYSIGENAPRNFA